MGTFEISPPNLEAQQRGYIIQQKRGWWRCRRSIFYFCAAIVMLLYILGVLLYLTGTSWVYHPIFHAKGGMYIRASDHREVLQRHNDHRRSFWWKESRGTAEDRMAHLCSTSHIARMTENFRWCKVRTMSTAHMAYVRHRCQPLSDIRRVCNAHYKCMKIEELDFIAYRTGRERSRLNDTHGVCNWRTVAHAFISTD